MPLRIGETFAGYRILRLLGAGGMGEVYLVQHPRLPRHDALKVLRPDVSSDASFQERFIREADVAAGLRHPHIVGIHDRGEHDGQLWIAMDYIDGTDAAELMQQRYPAGMPAELVIPIVTAVGSALDHAHKKGLLHRDVKPANIIVADHDTNEPMVFLADFGIARPLDDTGGITTTNMAVGTVAYSAPEQLMGEPLDGRADQYALAATTYHLLTGTHLFPHSNPAVIISRHLNAEPPSVSAARPELGAVNGVLACALAKSPAERFPKCAEFARALAESTSAPGPSYAASTRPAGAAATRPASGKAAMDRPGSPSANLVDWSPRRLLIIGVAVAVVTALAIAAFMWRPWQPNGPSSAQGSPVDQSNQSATPQNPTPATATPPPPSPSPQESPPAPAATAVQTTVAVVGTQPANGFHEVLNNVGMGLSDCDRPSPAATTANVYYCDPTAASADVCWAAPPGSMFCLDDPWARGLRRFAFDVAYLPQVQPVAHPLPYALLLDDGTRCPLLTGGARGGRPDRYLPAYNCGAQGSEVSVLMDPDASNAIDQSTPQWTVRVAALGAAPQTQSVTAAWFAGT